MNPSRLFILRPVATSLLMVAILLAGIIAYRVLPLSALPEVDYPTIQIVTLYPGASPDVTTSSITAPLERQFGQMPGLNQMSSTSSAGASVITLQFTLDMSLDVASDLQEQGLQVYVDIDRDTAGRLGVTPAAIDNALYNAYGQRLISTIFTQANQYRVVLEVKPEYQQGPAALSDIFVSAADGQQVRLSTIARISEKAASLAINHVGQFPSATISFNLAPGASLGEAVDAIRAAEKEMGVPVSVATNFQGAALAFQASLDNTLLLILAAIVTMYIVLGVLYESYIHPITILSTLPSAGVGALLALMLSGSDLGIIAIIGIILLIGIVKKNAIMMIDFALDAEREEGKTPREAIFQACLLRFRPILMTTMAALLGALPLMLGSGVGSELRQPLGITMVGGLLVSQVLTLFTTPVIYLAFDRLARRVNARRGRDDEAVVKP